MQDFAILIPHELNGNDFLQLPIQFEHLVKLSILPLHHRDPFDRLLIAQSLSENVPIVSEDTNFDRYGVQRIW